MGVVANALVWILVVVIGVLAIMLPVVVVTGMFGGQPLWGTIALVGLIALAFGVAWYVRTRGGTI